MLSLADLREKTYTIKDFFHGSIRTFVRIMGTNIAASFAYYGFFSIFPLVAFFIFAGSHFFSVKELSDMIYQFIDFFLPIQGALEDKIIHAVQAFISSRNQMGFLAVVLLLWGAMKFLGTLILGINQAWGITHSNFWLRSLKNLGIIALLALSLVFALILPAIMHALRRFLASIELNLYDNSYLDTPLIWDIIPLGALYFGILVLLALSPQKKVPLKFVWQEAIIVTLLLKITQTFFTFFITHFSNINVLYGAFGEIMSLLIWLHLAGIFIIFGACLSSSHYYAIEPKHEL